MTFIFKEEEKVENVLLIPEMEDCKFLNYRMERLLNTNLWYISCKIRNDIRLQYCFSVNDPLDEDWDRRFDQIIHDKINKTFLFIKEEEDDGDEAETLSYIVMPNAEEHVWEYINVLSAKTVVDNLIAEKKIPPIVVLFIDLTDTREEDLSCNDEYVDLIVRERYCESVL